MRQPLTKFKNAVVDVEEFKFSQVITQLFANLEQVETHFDDPLVVVYVAITEGKEARGQDIDDGSTCQLQINLNFICTSVQNLEVVSAMVNVL